MTAPLRVIAGHDRLALSHKAQMAAAAAFPELLGDLLMSVSQTVPDATSAA